MASVVKTSRFTPPSHTKDINHQRQGVNGHPPHLCPPKDSNHVGQTYPEPHPHSLDPKVIIGNSTSNSRTQKPPLYPQNGRCGKGSYPPPKPVKTPSYPGGRGRQSASIVWRREGWSARCHGGLKHETLLQSGGQRGTRQGNNSWWVQIWDGLSVPPVLMFPLSSWRLLCLLAEPCSKSVNELQHSSPWQKKIEFMCVFDVCLCVCLCVGEGGVMCLLLLMSHDFPVFSTLQNVTAKPKMRVKRWNCLELNENLWSQCVWLLTRLDFGSYIFYYKTQKLSSVKKHKSLNLKHSRRINQLSGPETWLGRNMICLWFVHFLSHISPNKLSRSK